METHLLTRRKTPVTLLVAIAACIPLALATGSPRVGDETVQVFVKKVRAGSGRAEYHYSVTNRSAFPVHTLLVGWDQFYGGPTLAVYPTGWNGDTIPSDSYKAPPGWKFEIQPMEEESLITVKWVVTPQGRAIMGGESAGGFVVVIPNADSTYDVGGMWTAYVMGESPRFGTMKRAK